MFKTMKATRNDLAFAKPWQSLTVVLSAGNMKLVLSCLFAIFVSVSSVFACAMNSVVCKSGYNLSSDEVDFGGIGVNPGGESYWLYQMGTDNPDGHGALYYHSDEYQGHDYQVLHQSGYTNYFSYGSENQLYRLQDAINSDMGEICYGAFIMTAKDKMGQIFMGHARRRSSGPRGAFAPFVFRHIDNSSAVPDTTDYSFAHHGTVTNDYLIRMFNDISFHDWLAQYDTNNIINGTPTNYSDPTSIQQNRYVDSDYIFLWLIKHIEDHEWNVRNGVVGGLRALNVNNIIGPSSTLNIMFSDGNGVYAFTNGASDTHKLSYSDSSTNFKIRSYNTVDTNWTELASNTLYYFPVHGNIEKTYGVLQSDQVNYPLKAGLNWVCFPILHDMHGIYPDYTLRDVNNYSVKLATFTAPDEHDEWDYDHSIIQWDEDARISRTNGYILEMDPLLPNGTHFTSIGTKTDYNTTLSLYAGYENWLPYFLENSQTPMAAFGSNFSYVTAIHAQDWYIYKFKGKWYGHLSPGATGTLDYGKMYKVFVDQDIPNFSWSNFGVSPTFVRNETEYFNYKEMPAYQAIVIESISGDPVFEELGVFKDGVCVGALKYDGYPLNLQVYDDAFPDEFEYVLYSGEKHCGFVMKKYSHDGVQVQDRLTLGNKNQFSIVNLDKATESENAPYLSFSASVYPNPFKGSTNIEIKSSTKSTAIITIYNLRGQLVKKMEALEISKGNNSFVWNSKNDNGELVAQGLYYCKIELPNQTLTKKITILR